VACGANGSGLGWAGPGLGWAGSEAGLACMGGNPTGRRGPVFRALPGCWR
jgi:hypothetical protein